MPGHGSAPFEIDEQVEDPFKLILLGALAEKDLIPARLQLVVEILSGLDYVKYYQTLRESDLVIPAFRGTAYYSEMLLHLACTFLEADIQFAAVAASSSIAAAVIAQVSKNRHDPRPANKSGRFRCWAHAYTWKRIRIWTLEG